MPPASTADLALRTSEARYRRLFEAAQDGILLLNAETAQIEDVNPYLINMLGYSHAEMLGKKLWDVGLFRDVDKSAELFAQLQATGYVRYDDLPLKTRQGAVINVEFVSNSYECEGVRVIQCNIRNLTAQRSAEERAWLLHRVVEQLPVSIAITSLTGQIEYINEALRIDSGYTHVELMGRNLALLRGGAEEPGQPSAMEQALAQELPWKGEFTGRRKDGSEYAASAVAAPIRRADGRISHHVCISTDITQRKHDTQELQRHRHQLESLVEVRTQELALAKRKAEAANIAKSAFLANMSHEIRTPLGAITGMAYLIRRSQVTPQQGDWLTKLETAGQHLLDLINAILDLSKIDAGKLDLEVVDVNVTRIAANVVSMLFERAAAKRLYLKVETHTLPQGLAGDAARLQQALLNYASNAIKFTREGGVTLRVSCQQDSVDSALIRFEVQDTGIGIAAEVLPRLFTTFEQADNSTTRSYGGTGLGLAIVRQIAGLMGGECGVNSAPGQGSTFWFTARLRKDLHPPPELVLRVRSAESRLALAHSGARVLVVDDEPVNREVTLALLSTALRHVDAAEDGPAAIRMAALQPYDLILMDVQMPGMDGYEATRRIRMLPGGAQSCIVALTANAFAEDRARCAAAGMDDFLAKPCQVDALFEALHAGLNRKRQGRG